MFERNKIEQLLAVAAYEPLSTADQAWLDRKLKKYPEYRDLADDFRDLKEIMAADAPAFRGDLLPAVRAELREAPLRRRRQWAALSMGLAASAVVAAGGVFAAYTLNTTPAPLQQVQEASAMGQAIAQAQALSAAGEFRAVQVLRDAIAARPEDPRAGEAQLLLADLEFGHGERYAEAYASYDALRARYSGTWSEHPECAERFALLADARHEEFRPLYELERARRDGAFESLENIVARYPNRELAFAAIDAMRETAGALESNGSAFEVAALEAVRSRCSDPIALAQIDVTLGNLYWKELKDTDRALDLFCGVSEAAPVQLAQAAAVGRDALGTCPNPAP